MYLERLLNRRSSCPHANLEIRDPIGDVTCGNNFLLGRLPSHLRGHDISLRTRPRRTHRTWNNFSAPELGKTETQPRIDLPTRDMDHSNLRASECSGKF